MTMDVTITVVLMLLAVLLLVVEVALIPGFGFAGVLGVLLMVTSISLRERSRLTDNALVSSAESNPESIP